MQVEQIPPTAADGPDVVAMLHLDRVLGEVVPVQIRALDDILDLRRHGRVRQQVLGCPELNEQSTMRRAESQSSARKGPMGDRATGRVGTIE